jgi:hypothetical protein
VRACFEAPVLGTTPWVEDGNTQSSEVLDIAGHKRQVVFNGSSGDHTVCRVKGRSPQLAFAVQHAPSFSDSRV